MPHKANKSFFEQKRTWSRYKDQILQYYLAPYLAKVARLGRPILLVDAFAGPGRFDDREPGSPLIICQRAQAAISRGARVSLLCIESDPQLFTLLKKNLSAFSFATPLEGTFVDHLLRIQEAARSHTVFLYVDPWTPEGLYWAPLDRVFKQTAAMRTSIELLLNFNAGSFARRALAALQRSVPVLDPATEDPEEPGFPTADPTSSRRLNEIVGGNWWRTALQRINDFPGQVRALNEGVCRELRRRFREVASTPIKARADHLVPKYYLVFAARHPDALELMNDAMVKARGSSLFYTNLFARADLERRILEFATDHIRRGELILRIMRWAFCAFTRTEIRRTIESLLKSGALRSETGKARINDSVKVISTAADA